MTIMGKMNTLGAYVSKRRKDLSFRQQDLADALGYTVQAISKFENGLSAMDITSLPLLAKCLSLSLNDLLDQSPDPKDPPCSMTFSSELLSANLKALRLKEGLTQKALGEKMGVSERSIQSYEKGKSLPSLDGLLLLKAAYPFNADQLFFQKAEPVLPAPKIKHPRLFWLIPILLALVGGSVGASYPLWGKKEELKGSSSLSPESSSSTSSSAASSESSSLSEGQSSSSAPSSSSASSSESALQNDLASVTSIQATFADGTFRKTLEAGVYPLQVTIDPSSWYSSSRYAQIGWIFDNDLSSDPSGASIVYDEINYTWSLKVRAECLNNGTYVFKPFIHSLIDSKYDLKATDILAVTFTSANTSLPATPTNPILKLKSYKMDIAGTMSVRGNPGDVFPIHATFDPEDWWALYSNAIGYNVSCPNADEAIIWNCDPSGGKATIRVSAQSGQYSSRCFTLHWSQDVFNTAFSGWLTVTVI